MFPRLIASMILFVLGVPLPVAGVDELEEIDECAATAAFLDAPQDVAVDGAGNVYIADRGDDRIRRVDAVTKRMTAVAGSGFFGFVGDGGPAVEARLGSPRGVAADFAGNVYIADTYNHRIRKVDAVAETIATIAGSGGFCFDNATVCGDGGWAAHAVLRSPAGVAVDTAGDFYIADTFNHRIRKVASGVINTIAGSAAAWSGSGGYGGDTGPAVEAQLNSPADVAVSRRGVFYIVDRGNNRIRKVYPDPDDPEKNLIDTIAGTGVSGFSGDTGPAVEAQLNNPQGVAVDIAGNVYIADTDNHRVRRINRRTETMTTLAGTGVSGFSGDGGPASEAQLNQPVGVAVDIAGNVYIADRGNRRIRKVDLLQTITTIAGRGGDREVDSQQPPGVCASSFEMSFALPQDAEPASQTVILYVAAGGTDFQVRPGPRWITAAPQSGSLTENEEAAVEVTVDPAGLRVGAHRGWLYIRSGERVAARVHVVLEVSSPLGPAVSEHSVMNAAAMSAFGRPGLFGPALLPVAPGSMVAVLGENFTSGENIDADVFPLPSSLGGVRVKFNDMEGRLFSVGPNRIEAQLPSALGMSLRPSQAAVLEAGGLARATVVVETAEAKSYPRSFVVGAHAPGIFTVSGEGKGQAAVLFAGTSILAAASGAGVRNRPARAGDVVEIYATGLGPVYPPIADGENSCGPDGVCLTDSSNIVLRSTLEMPRVRIGGVWVAEENVLFSGQAPALAAVNVVVVEVPQWIAPSDEARVVIVVGGRQSQPGVTMAVE